MSQTTAVRARYQIIAKVASGGMGEVYRARDSVLARDVAIKVLHRNLAGDPGFIERFRREARAAALLSHPNIVAVHDWGATTNGTYFMVMEFVRGRNVRDLLTHFERFEPQQAVEVLVQMLAALDHAHQHGIVHRDVKPENVLVTPEGQVKVADFGLARAFAESRVSQAPGTVTGTVQYLAPEQIQGEPADPRTDLYATGILAYELLTGHVPFSGETSLAIAYRHLSDRVPPPSKAEPTVPQSLDRLVTAATEKDRDRRPDSAADLRAGLLAVAPSLPAAAPLGELVRELPDDVGSEEDRAFTVTIPQRMSPKARRRRNMRRLTVALMAITLLVVGALAAWAYVIPHYTHVPRVLGLAQDDAQARIIAAGLDPQFGPPQTSTTVPEGEVLRQSVDPGTEVEKGTDVTLRLSAGLPLRTVPVATGKTLGAAQEELKAEGLRVRVKHAFSNTVRQGMIIEQNPTAGQQILFDSEVILTVSDGRQPVEVPEVAGHSSTDAQSLLVSAGLEPVLEQDYSTTVPENDVISQDPAAHDTVPIGSKVHMVVSLGPRTFPMPYVVGMSASDAQAQLEALGLNVTVLQIPGCAACDRVVGQSVSRDVELSEGDSVKIYVA